MLPFGKGHEACGLMVVCAVGVEDRAAALVVDGGGAHAPDEYMLIESTNPKVQGYAGATKGFVDFLYEMATIG